MSLTFCLSNQLHTPILQGNWRTEKSYVRNVLLGSIETIMTRSLFAGANLNLSVYGGYQQVFTNQSLKFDSVDFSLQLNEGGRVDFIFNKMKSGASSFRFLHNSRVVELFSLNGDNRFLDSQKFLLKNPIPKNVDVSIFKKLNKIALRVNDEELLIDNRSIPFEGVIGFIGNFSPGKVKYVKTIFENKINFKDDFFPTIYYKFALVLLFIFVIVSIPFVLKNRLNKLFYFTLFFLILTLFDFYSSQREFYWDWYEFTPKESLDKHKLSFEKYRFQLTNSLLNYLNKPMMTQDFLTSYTKSFTANRGDIICYNKNCVESRGEFTKESKRFLNSPYKVLIASGSFGLGAGLNDNRDIFTHLMFEKILGKKEYTLVNLPYDGRFDMENIYKELKKYLDDYRPDVFVFNLFVGKNIGIYSKLVAFLSNYSKKAKIIVIEQVYQVDKLKIPYKRSEYVVNSLKEIGVLYFDLNLFLFTDAFKSIGITHWDSGHLTKLGHFELANYYKVELENFLKN